MNLAEFVDKYVHTKVDYDKAFGVQCVDLFRQYCKDVLQYPHTGAVDGAKDLYEKYDQLPQEKFYFQRFELNPAPGDVAVWGATKTNKFGHVAIVLSEIGDNLMVLEQDGLKQNGVHVNLRSKKGLLGYLGPQI